jgi:hypothetical protein
MAVERIPNTSEPWRHCPSCLDSGLVAVDHEEEWDGHLYDRFAAPCDQCQEGQRREAWARRWAA